MIRGFKFPITVDDQEIYAILSFPEDKDDSVSVSGYDVEAELAAEALGLSSPIGQLASDWRGGAGFFIAQGDNLEHFFGNVLDEENEEAYGLFTKQVLSKIFNTALQVIVAGAADIDESEFFSHVEDLDFRNIDYDDLDWDQDLIASVAEAAWRNDDYDLIKALRPLYTRGEFAELTEDSAKCDEEGETSVKCSVTYNFYFLEKLRHEWTIRVVAKYTTAELTDFEFEEDDNSEEPPSDVEPILNDMDEDTDWVSRVEQEAYYSQPEVPDPDYSGDFAVFIDGSLHGRFEDMGDAERFVEMSREVVEREGLDNDVGLYKIIEGLEEEAEEEDEYFDEDDIDNWSEII